MSIRTTLTLDDDLVARIKEESRARGASFRETLNNLLRYALASAAEKPRRSLAITPSRMGYRRGLNHDSVEALLEFAEGDAHR